MTLTATLFSNNFVCASGDRRSVIERQDGTIDIESNESVKAERLSRNVLMVRGGYVPVTREVITQLHGIIDDNWDLAMCSLAINAVIHTVLGREDNEAYDCAHQYDDAAFFDLVGFYDNGHPSSYSFSISKGEVFSDNNDLLEGKYGFTAGTTAGGDGKQDVDMTQAMQESFFISKSEIDALSIDRARDMMSRYHTKGAVIVPSHVSSDFDILTLERRDDDGSIRFEKRYYVGGSEVV